MFKYGDIRKVHLEISSRCNASCPECLRNLRGGDIEDHGDYVVHDMSLSEAQTIFPVDFLQQLDIFTINGNFGDFITCRDGLEIVQYISDANPRMSIEISTNASGQPKIWSQLGKIKNLQVIFRIDGLADTHHLYRQYTDFDLIISNAKRFIAAGGNAAWYTIEFDFNQHQRDTARQMSKDLGFKEFRLINHGRNNTVVFTRDGEFSHTIGTPDPDIRDYQVLLDMREFVKTREGGNRVYYESRISKKKIRCQVQNPASIYVQSNGQVYPCCWVGFAPDTNKITPGMDQTAAIAKNNNALDVGIESAMSWFAELEKTWSIDTVLNGRHYKCNSICGSDD